MKTMASFQNPISSTRPWTRTTEPFLVRGKSKKVVNGRCDDAQRRIHCMPKIPVLVIEDNRILRESIASMLKRHTDFEVIESGDTIRQLNIQISPPHVVLLNPGFKDDQGLKLMSLLRDKMPKAKPVVMDILPDRADVIAFVKAGACGFILKNAHENEYVKTIKTVAEGSNVLPPILTGSLFTQIVESALKNGSGAQENFMQLTNREREIVDLVSEGLSNKGIAEHLHIATFTVKSHIHNILEKLALNSRLQIAAFIRKETSGWSGIDPMSQMEGSGFENLISV